MKKKMIFATLVGLLATSSILADDGDVIYTVVGDVIYTFLGDVIYTLF